MPRMNGVEFLKIVKADPHLRGIPVVVLTTSKADQDRNECFNRSVAGYIVKPVDYVNFLEAIRILDLYWSLSELPPDVSERTDINLENALTNLK
jgi:CheY-like chemotaxis protein